MMDVKNFFKEDQKFQMNPQFNSCQLNFETKDVSDLNFSNEDNVCVIEQHDKNCKKNNMMKHMFQLMATYDAKEVVSIMKSKYPVLFDQNLQKLCLQIGDLIGNYFVSCRYNDNLGNKNTNFVKYVIMCDCDHDNCCQQEIVNGGGIDGFFDNKKHKITKIRVCKKHNLPILSSIEDLSEQDFAKLAKSVSQIKNIPLKQVEKNTQNKKIISKIARVFKNLKPKNKVAKIDIQSHKISEANTQLKADVSKEQTQVNVQDVKKPTGEKLSYKLSKQFEESNVNLPVNKVAVKVKNKQKTMNSFTITPNKYDDLQLSKQAKTSVNIPGKNITVAVQKESKFVQNISIYTQPVKTQYDLENNYTIDLTNQNTQQLIIDNKSSFDF